MKRNKIVAIILSFVMMVSTLTAVGITQAGAAVNLYFAGYLADDITTTTAHVHSELKNPGKSILTEAGCTVWRKDTNWSKTFVNKNIDKVKGLDTKKGIKIDYYIGTSGTAKGTNLTPNKTYYFQFYVKVKGQSKKYTSLTKSFNTYSIPVATSIQFPLSTKLVWYASTYQGHGKAFGAAYSSVDIVLKNGKSPEGQPVYAAEAGKVKSYDSKNGQIVIEHTKKLVTTNNKTYTKWYTIYAHMKNIKVKVGNSVKRGQQIGQVSKVGNATAPHLHFNIISGNGGTAWCANNKNKAISPYYVYGFVQANGKNASYCVCDRSGPAVTATLINWKPTGK